MMQSWEPKAHHLRAVTKEPLDSNIIDARYQVLSRTGSQKKTPRLAGSFLQYQTSFFSSVGTTAWGAAFFLLNT